jgi:hypothetical protein
MKPGRVKSKFGSIGSPFYSRSHEQTKDLVSCFRGLSQRCDEAHSQATRLALKLTRELFVISIIPNLLSDDLTNTFDCYKANQCWSANAREFDDGA